jgi:hypothetical protein
MDVARGFEISLELQQIRPRFGDGELPYVGGYDCRYPARGVTLPLNREPKVR